MIKTAVKRIVLPVVFLVAMLAAVTVPVLTLLAGSVTATGLQSIADLPAPISSYQFFIDGSSGGNPVVKVEGNDSANGQTATVSYHWDNSYYTSNGTNSTTHYGAYSFSSSAPPNKHIFATNSDGTSLILPNCNTGVNSDQEMIILSFDIVSPDKSIGSLDKQLNNNGIVGTFNNNYIRPNANGAYHLITCDSGNSNAKFYGRNGGFLDIAASPPKIDAGNPNPGAAQWLDYNGTPANPNSINGSRFRFISPFEIVDTQSHYGDGKDVIYSTGTGSDVGVRGGNGNLRPFNDGINLYWLRNEDGTQLVKDKNNNCYGGFSVKAGDGDKYGTIYALSTYYAPVNNACFVGNSPAEDVTSIGGHLGGTDPKYISALDPGSGITNQFSGTDRQLWFSMFAWSNPNTLVSLEGSNSISLTKLTDTTTVNNILNNELVNPTFPQGTKSNVAIFTSDSCKQSDGTYKGFLLVDDDTSKTQTTDADVEVNTHAVFYKETSSGALSYAPGGNNLDCLNGSSISTNPKPGFQNPYAQDWYTYVAYPSKSVGNAAGSMGSLANLASQAKPGSTSGGAASTITTPKCDLTLNPLTWLICPLYQAAIDAVNTLDNAIISELTVDVSQMFDTTDASGNAQNYYRAWSSIRDLALGSIVVIGLVMVISQAIDAGPFDAYTVRKVLPRLLVAAIIIALSWQLMTAAVDISNGLGYGVSALLTAPFANLPTAHLQSGGSTALALVGGGAIIGLGLLGLLSFALVGLLAVLIGFATVIFRQILIIFLVIVAPLGIAAYILPGTEKGWKLWRDSFLGALIAFPLITGMIAMGRIFSAVSYNAGKGGLLDQLIAMIAYFAPYFLIPTAFKLAGGVLSTVSGRINDRSRGPFDRIKKARQAHSAELWKRSKNNQRWQGNAAGRRLSRSLQTATLLPKAGIGGIVNPRTGIGRVQGARHIVDSAALKESMEKDQAFAAIKDDDTLLTAAIRGGSGNDIRNYLEGQGQHGRELDQNVESILRARRSMGGTFAAASILAKSGTGTGYNDVDAAGNYIGHGLMLQDILAASNGNRSMERSLIAGTKSAMNNGRRYDIGGASFGASLTQMEALRNGTATAISATAALQDSSLDAQGAGAVVGGRADSAQAFAPALQRRTAAAVNNLAVAQATGNPEIIEAAQREMEQTIASTEALIDVASQASPENGRILANGVHSMPIDLAGLPPEVRDFIATNRDGTRSTATTMTVRQLMDHLGPREAYNEMRRTYTNSYQSDAAARRGPLGGAPPGGPPGGAPPGGPII